jgi:hypothetical protein
VLEIIKTIFIAIGGPFILLIGLFIVFYTFKAANIDPAPVLYLGIALTPIWLPVVLTSLAFERWSWFIELKFIRYNGRSTLRLHLPQEVFKSPQAMEGVMNQIHNVQTPDNIMQTYLDGKQPLTFSFEIVSIGGEVRFYINCPTRKSKNAVEAQLYAHYPGIEVVEEPLDYSLEIPWDPDKYEYMSFHMAKREKQFLPIRTYIDYGLDKIPKEEEKFEPMAAMIEHLAKVKPHDRLWVQFLCIPHKKKGFKEGSPIPKADWTKEAIEYIEKILKRTKEEPGELGEPTRAPMLTAGERDDIAAIERNINKYGYETGIRWVYISPKGKFDGDIISPTIKTFAQYDFVKRNNIGVKWRTDYDYPKISDPSGRKRLNYKKAELEMYKLRYYYYQDRYNKADIMKVFSVEELATMFHLPGTSVVTPSLARIESNRKEAPTNLPTGVLTDI